MRMQEHEPLAAAGCCAFFFPLLNKQHDLMILPLRSPCPLFRFARPTNGDAHCRCTRPFTLNARIVRCVVTMPTKYSLGNFLKET